MNLKGNIRKKVAKLLKEFFFEPEELANIEKFKKRIMDEFETMYNPASILTTTEIDAREFEEDEAAEIKTKAKDFYDTYKFRLENILKRIKRLPESDIEVPSLWWEGSDAWDDVSEGNFSGLEWYLDELVGYLETLT